MNRLTKQSYLCLRLRLVDVALERDGVGLLGEPKQEVCLEVVQELAVAVGSGVVELVDDDVVEARGVEGAQMAGGAARVEQRRAEERSSAAAAATTITVDDAREALWATSVQ